MGTDTDRKELIIGNAITINVEPDTKEQTDKLFAKLSEGGTVDTPLQTMFWGDYFGTLTDKFGIPWMFNCSAK
jgi:PhnB protein